MSRSLGGTWVTSRAPIRIAPALTCSRPASMRRQVDLPHPEGPTRTRNSPSPISRSNESTASLSAPGYRRLALSNVIVAIRHQPLDRRGNGGGSGGEEGHVRVFPAWGPWQPLETSALTQDSRFAQWWIWPATTACSVSRSCPLDERGAWHDHAQPGHGAGFASSEMVPDNRGLFDKAVAVGGNRVETAKMLPSVSGSAQRPHPVAVTTRRVAVTSCPTICDV